VASCPRAHDASSRYGNESRAAQPLSRGRCPAHSRSTRRWKAATPDPTLPQFEIGPSPSCSRRCPRCQRCRGHNRPRGCGWCTGGCEPGLWETILPLLIGDHSHGHRGSGFFALTSTPSRAPSSAELTRPLSAPGIRLAACTEAPESVRPQQQRGPPSPTTGI